MKPLHDIASEGAKERAALVAIRTPHMKHGESEENLLELQRLADTAGAEAVATIVQERDHPDAVTYIGKGKAQELAALVQTESINLVIFDDDLSPNQGRNLEELCNCKIIDRSGLILDIFAGRARTREAQTQVELAQMEYLLPRLTRMWTHLSKQFGGIGTKGPGETQLETDRRIIRNKITKLKEKLKTIDSQRSTQHAMRKHLPRVALVGYTNVGKSTLFHALTHADVLIEDRLFATLDATTRAVKAGGLEFLLTDTVGFIRKLPTHLIASFRSTLAEVSEADVIALVVDASHPFFEEQTEVVRATLADLGTSEKPTLMVFNKIDDIRDTFVIETWKQKFPEAVFVSALKEINLNPLLDILSGMITRNYIEREVVLSHDSARAAARLYEITTVLQRTYGETTVTLRLRYPAPLAPIVQRIIDEPELVSV